MKILLVGHAFAPDRGSEPGFTWNWAWHLAQQHEIWVLAYPEYRNEVEEWLARSPRKSIHIVWITLPSWLDPFKPARGQRWVRFHYYCWQWAALRAAKRLHASIVFDVAHHVSLGTVRVPPRLWKLNIPFVWGPIGGGQQAPKQFWRYFGRTWTNELLRNLHIALLPHRSGLRKAALRTGVILATNQETAAVLGRAGAKRITMMLDGGLDPSWVPDQPPARSDTHLVRFLWAGRIEPRKGLAIAIESFETAARNLPVELVIVGDGSERANCEKRAQRSDVRQQIRFVGKVPWPQMPQVFRTADVFLFTSLQDSFGTVVLEAMAQGLPVVALNHQGPAAFVPDAAAIKVQVTIPSATTVRLAQAIRTLALNAALRTAMGRAAWSFARLHTWDRRARSMGELYDRLRDGFTPDLASDPAAVVAGSHK